MENTFKLRAKNDPDSGQHRTGLEPTLFEFLPFCRRGFFHSCLYSGASISTDGWGGCRPMYFSLSQCDFLTRVKVAAVNMRILVKIKQCWIIDAKLFLDAFNCIGM